MEEPKGWYHRPAPGRTKALYLNRWRLDNKHSHIFCFAVTVIIFIATQHTIRTHWGYRWMSSKGLYDWKCQSQCDVWEFPSHHTGKGEQQWGSLHYCSSGSLIPLALSPGIILSLQCVWLKQSFALLFCWLDLPGALIGVRAPRPVASCQWFSSLIRCSAPAASDRIPLVSLPCLLLSSLPSVFRCGPDICFVYILLLPIT